MTTRYADELHCIAERLRVIAEDMRDHEAHHSENVFDALPTLAAKLDVFSAIEGRLEPWTPAPTERRVEIGMRDAVVVDKCFGPASFCEVRVSVADGCKWRIERSRSVDKGGTDEDTWECVVEFDAREE